MPRVLHTNDDGYQAAGIQAVRTALLEAGLDVITLAPDGDRSGAGRQISCHGPVAVERVADSDAAPILTCTGTPVDCVRIALMARPFPDVDVVVAGFNHGVNMGDDATYYATLGAALEAALHGVPAIALSQQDRGRRLSVVSSARHEFAYASLVPHLVGSALLDPPSRAAVNVNVPGEVRDPRALVTRLGRLEYGRRWMRPVTTTEHGWTFESYLRPDDPHPRIDRSEGTDTAALLDGRVSITPLTFEPGGGMTRRRLDAWAQRIAAATTAALRKAA